MSRFATIVLTASSTAITTTTAPRIFHRRFTPREDYPVRGSRRWEALGSGLEFDPRRVRRERDQVVEARERDQLDQLGWLPGPCELGPEVVGDGRVVVELVGEPDEQGLAGRPDGIARVCQDGCRDLALGEAHLPREDGGVDAPFVLASTARAGAVDHDLAIDRLELAEVEQIRPRRPEALEDVLVPGDGAKQLQRLDPGGIMRFRVLRERVGVRGLAGLDAGWWRRRSWRSSFASKTEAATISLLNPKRNPAPSPGRPVRGSRTGRPIMALLDLLGRRWTLRVLWELREEGLGFRELQARCDAMSASVLSQRLRELREAGIVAAGASGVNA